MHRFLGVLLWFCLLTGCVTKAPLDGTEQSARNDFVTVRLEGNVKEEGVARIRREFSERSILEAGKGWGPLSDFGVKPRTFSLTRVTEGRTNIWRISFKEMSGQKWKRFLFEQGDRIYVNTLYF